MATTDLFLRSKPKVRPTDLWLHPAGADGATPVEPYDSGTVSTVALFDGLAGLADSQIITAVANHSVTTSLSDQGGISTVAVHSASEALSALGGLMQQGVIVAVAKFGGVAILVDQGKLSVLALHTGVGLLAAAPPIPGTPTTVSFVASYWSPVSYRDNRFTESLPVDQRSAEEVALIRLGRVPRNR